MKITILLIASYCFLYAPVFAQEERGLKITDQQNKKTKEKLALVIGNSDYQSVGKLVNPVNDADSMTRYLKKLQFDVLTYKNLDLKSTENAINKFQEQLKNYKIGLFFFAGHGAEASGENYLFPIDANPVAESDAKHECYSLNQLLEKMDGSETNINIVIIDACRNNPFKKIWGGRNAGEQGLASVQATKGTVIGFAASPGFTAADGKGKNGVYTSCILKNIALENTSVLDMFTRVNDDVQAQTGKKQVPFLSSSLNNIYYLNFNAATATPTVIYVNNAEKNEPRNKDGKSARSTVKSTSTIELLNGASYEQTTSTDNLTFTVLPGNKLSFSGKIRSYLVSGKLRQLKNMDFQVTEGNVTGNISFTQDNELITGSITIKQSKLLCTLNLTRKE